MIVKQLSLTGEHDKIVYRDDKQPSGECVGRFISAGYGLQSSVLVEMACAGELEVAAVIFADTGDEPYWVYDQRDYMEDKCHRAGIKAVTVHKSDSQGIIADAKMAKYKRFATMPLYTKEKGRAKEGMLRRQCTKEYKIEPIESWLRDWLIERGYGRLDKRGRRYINKGYYIETLLGITWDEAERMNEKHFPKWQSPIYPLIDTRMERGDCIKWLADRDLPIPRKSSCFICPFHSNAYWQELKDNDPAIFEEACEFDDWLRIDDSQYYRRKLNSQVYLHRSCVPLREVDFSLPMFEDAVCGAYCFV